MSKQVIILAGGKGVRLQPYTISLPKSLVPVGDKPILEIIIKQLKQHGFQKITLAVGHLAELIEAYFGNGQKYGVDINYSVEDDPLGTVAPLKLLNDLDDDFLVMNSDDLTDFDYSGFLSFHEENKAAITIARYVKKVKIDLGVLKINPNNELTDYIEKPDFEFDVSMGIYAFNKSTINFIPANEYFDFPTLVKLLLSKGKKVLSYCHSGYWLDIGRPEDYEKANNDYKLFERGLFK